MRRSLSGNRRISIVKCLTIECCDFKKISLTFVDFGQSAQPWISLTETLRQSFLIPEFNPKQGEIVTEQNDNVISNGSKFHVLHGNDDDDDDNLSLSDDDEVEEGEELTNEYIKPIRSSPRVIKRELMSYIWLIIHVNQYNVIAVGREKFLKTYSRFQLTLHKCSELRCSLFVVKFKSSS